MRSLKIKTMFKAGQKLSLKSHRKRTIAIIAAVILIAGGGAFAFYRHNHPTSVKTPDGKTVKLKKATAEEKKASDDNKSAIVKRENTIKDASANSSGQTPSTVVITSPSPANPSVSGVRGYVTGVFEEGGTCTATATMGSQTVTKSSVGFQNVSYTQCAPIDWDSPLGHGTWAITLSYKSAATSSTQSTTIEVN
jgi:uncharacterized protein YxeA